MTRIVERLASNDKNVWITNAILTCQEYVEGDSPYSKPIIEWGPIIPTNIGMRKSARFNGVGYERYVPISERYVK